jgi:hypothetical protein
MQFQCKIPANFRTETYFYRKKVLTHFPSSSSGSGWAGLPHLALGRPLLLAVPPYPLWIKALSWEPTGGSALLQVAERHQVDTIPVHQSRAACPFWSGLDHRKWMMLEEEEAWGWGHSLHALLFWPRRTAFCLCSTTLV